jgi:hypothetical protein
MCKELAVTTWLVAFLAVSLHPLAAQEPSIQPGTRVRVKAPTLFSRPFVGTLESVRDSIVLVRGNEAMPATQIRLSQIERVEVSQGKKSNAGRGAIAGFLVGAAAGAGFGISACSGGGGCADVGTGTVALFTGAIGAGGGTLLGALIGLGSKSERWEEVSRERFRVGMTFNEGRGVGLRFSVGL